MVNIGFIGSGVTIRTYLPAFREHKNLNVLGLTSASYEKAKLIAGENNIPKVYPSYKELIQDPQIDLVCVASPNNFHFEQLKLAIENNKHLFAEKPLANNLKEIQEINRILKTTDSDSKKLAIINHQIRFNPHILKILSFINNKALGEVYFVKIHQQSIHFSKPDTKWNWVFDEDSGGGVTVAMGSHLIDLIHFWFRDHKITKVKGSLHTIKEKKVDSNENFKDVMTECFFSADLNYKNLENNSNLNVQLSTTSYSFGIPRFDVSILGSKGELHFDLYNKLTGAFLDDYGKLKKIVVEGVRPEDDDFTKSLSNSSFLYLAKELSYYFALRENSLLETATKFHEAIENQKILDAIKKSADCGTIIDL